LNKKIILPIAVISIAFLAFVVFNGEFAPQSIINSGESHDTESLDFKMMETMV